MCGIFGFAKTSNRQSDRQLDILKDVFTELTDESSIRGTDSTGFSIINPRYRETYKTLKDSSSLVDSKLWDSEILSRINRETTIVMGHVRLATHGTVKVSNAHPFDVGNVTGVHNGIIHNYNKVAKRLGKTTPEVDSQVIFQSLNNREMSKAFEDIDGDFAITWVKDSNNKVHLARESGRPMVIAYWKKARVLLWASTREILLDAMTRAGLVLPISTVPTDYVFTYDTDKFNNKPSYDKVEFETMSQYDYNTQYYGNIYSNPSYNGYSYSPASMLSNGITTGTETNDMCKYCYEWMPVDELYIDEYNKNTCIDCEYLSEDYKNKTIGVN